MASKSGSSNPIVGYKYFFAMHMGAGRGPQDSLVEIRVGDLTAWKGESTDNEEILINEPNLFGGVDKEGGIQGTLAVLMGAKTQVVQSWIKDQLGGLVSDFRGRMTLYYDGLVCVNNPYPKQWKFRTRRALKGWMNDDPWYPEKAVIEYDDGSGVPIKAMNGAHIIYECATNEVWGRGLPASAIDADSFTAAADTLFSENFGLCLRWTRQDEIDNFVKTVINHIGGSLFISRQTGLLTLRLIRNDYDAEDLPHFDFNSGLISISQDESNAIDTSYNEIIVNFHKPGNDEDAQVKIQNLASIQSIKNVISATVDYPGLPDPNLALRIAQRDLQMQSSGLRKLVLKMDRRGWTIEPGDVFRITAPTRGIENLILRAGKIEDSPLVDGTITVSSIQDVFGLPFTSYIGYQPSDWVPPDKTLYPVSVRRIEEATYRDLVTILPTTTLDGLADDSSFIKTLGKRPSGLSVDYIVYSQAGGDGYQNRGRNGWEPVASLVGAIGVYTTAITFDGKSDTSTVVAGVPLLIGNEYVRLDAIDLDAGTATIARGCLDTIPATHADNTLLWFEVGTPGGDGREYTTGEDVDVQLLTRTNSGQLAPEDAPVDSLTIAGRQGRPYPPGNLKVNGTAFANVTSVTGEVVLTWAHRDRVMQADFLLEHGAGSTGPEPGTTYNIRVYTTDGLTQVRGVAGITGTTWTYTNTMSIADGALTNPRFVLESSRDSLVSWQKYDFTIQHVTAGFGEGFGYDFGGP